VVVSASPVRGALPAGAQLVRVDSFLLRNMQTFDFERGALGCWAKCRACGAQNRLTRSCGRFWLKY
jgi:hypothetical protein